MSIISREDKKNRLYYGLKIDGHYSRESII